MNLSSFRSSLSSQIKEISYWKNIIKRVVSVIERLLSRYFAFMGSNTKFGDEHSGHYIMLTELIAEFDPLPSKPGDKEQLPTFLKLSATNLSVMR